MITLLHNCTMNFLREPPCQTEPVFPCLCMAQFTYSFNDYVLCGSHETLSCYVLTQLIILVGTINNRKNKDKNHTVPERKLKWKKGLDTAVGGVD